MHNTFYCRKMQGNRFKSSIILKLEIVYKEYNNVITGRSDCLVAWDYVCHDFEEGGLGVKNLQIQNVSLLTKFVYCILTEHKLEMWCAKKGKLFSWQLIKGRIKAMSISFRQQLLDNMNFAPLVVKWEKWLSTFDWNDTKHNKFSQS
jgi:hypothetical protein